MKMRSDLIEEFGEAGHNGGLEGLYVKFILFEEYTFKAEENNYSDFLTEWQRRQASALAAGFAYSDLMLAFKLLKNSGLEYEVQSAVFAALQSSDNHSTEKILAQTMICLNEIMSNQPNQTIKVEDLDVLEDDENVKDQIKGNILESPGFPEDDNICNDEEDDNYDNEKNHTATDDKADDSNKLLNSITVRPGPNPVCVHCGQEFHRNSLLVIHLKDVHPENYITDTVPCDECDKRFMDAIGMAQHKETVHNKKHACTIDKCEYTCNRLALLKRHQDTMHSPDKDYSTRRKVPSAYKKKNENVISTKEELTQWKDLKRYQCDECGEEVSDAAKIKQHIKSHYQFKCEPCKNKPFGTQEELEAHILKHDAIPCDQCDQVFTLKSNLTAHKVAHHGLDNRKFACDICGKFYRSSSNLINHKLFHGAKRFHCTVEGCDRSYVVKTKLREHIMYVHTGEKNFNCEQCGKSFVNTYRLKVHQDRHKGIKKFPCDFCEKRFFDNGKLKVHRRIHTGERPYKCCVCEKTFVQSKDLKLHKEKLHPTLF